MLGSQHGAEQSMDCAAQNVDLCFEQQSMDAHSICGLSRLKGEKHGFGRSID